jgi:hypothetical protein
LILSPLGIAGLLSFDRVVGAVASPTQSAGGAWRYIACAGDRGASSPRRGKTATRAAAIVAGTLVFAIALSIASALGA